MTMKDACGAYMIDGKESSSQVKYQAANPIDRLCSSAVT
jgi:hypothetical protein